MPRSSGSEPLVSFKLKPFRTTEAGVRTALHDLEAAVMDLGALAGLTFRAAAHPPLFFVRTYDAA